MFERVPGTSAALDAFLSDLELEGRSPATRDTYRSLLGPLRTQELTPEACRAYVTAKVRGGKLSSAGTAHAALSSWCRWMVMRGYLLTSPMATMVAHYTASVMEEAAIDAGRQLGLTETLLGEESRADRP